MLVEDDLELHPVLVDFLSDYRVLLASSGEEALDILKKEKLKIDLVLCDYNMEEWNGIETIKKLRKISPHTRFILMSGSEPDVLPLLASKVNADAWLSKPFSEEALLGKIETIFKENHFEAVK